MKGVLCHVINAGRLRCHTPRATSRMHHVARPSGAGTGRAVPDYRSQAKHRRRARQGRVTPRLELMTLGGTVERPLNSDTDRAGCGPCQLQSCTSKLVAPVLVYACLTVAVVTVRQFERLVVSVQLQSVSRRREVVVP